MKKKLHHLEILKNRQTIVLSEKIEKKAHSALKRAAGQPPRRFISFFYRPAFVFTLAAFFLIVPVSVVVLTLRSIPEKPVIYTARETIRNREKENLSADHLEDLLLEYMGEDTVKENRDLYKKNVTSVDVRITSRGLIMKWKNPEDIKLKEIIIEKRKKRTSQVKTLLPGNVNFYVDSEYDPGDYYLIRCINEKNIPSRGVYVIPEEGEK